jgi:hypothetical protein
MHFYTVQRAWMSLLVVGLPTACLALAWVVFMGGRPVAALLAFAYLLIAVVGRAQAARRERREQPHRRKRVVTQLERIRSTLPDLY